MCYGRNTIAGKIRELSKICGWLNWEECTNHGIRTLWVTILHNNKEINLTIKPILNHYHHADPTSQNPYNRETAITNSTLQNTLIGDVSEIPSVTPALIGDVSEILCITPVDTELLVL